MLRRAERTRLCSHCAVHEQNDHERLHLCSGVVRRWYLSVVSSQEFKTQPDQTVLSKNCVQSFFVRNSDTTEEQVDQHDHWISPK